MPHKIAFNKHLLVAVFLLTSQSSAIAEESTDKAIEQARAAIDRRDFAEAVEIAAPLAARGIAPAQNIIGDLDKATGELEQSVLWYRRAAEQGYAKAQNNLGMAYITGKGVTINDEQGVKWLVKAAEQGHPKAQNNLSVLYSKGIGVAKDPKIAAQWCKKAAEQGDPAAQTNFAIDCRYGKGVEKDEKEALRWFQKAADQGFDNAQYELGEMYEYGIGTNRDKETALNWYRKAAEQQLPAAVDKLVSMLEVRKQTELGTVCLDVGQTASIEFDTSAGGLVHPRRISPDPDSELKRHGKPNSIDLSLTFDSKMNSTLLHLQNNFNGTISYDCVIRAPESKFQSTDVLEVPSGVTVHEMWPGKLEQLMVRNFRRVNSNTQK